MLRLKALEVAVVEVAKDHSYWCALTAGELENTWHLEIREHRAIKKRQITIQDENILERRRADHFC